MPAAQGEAARQQSACRQDEAERASDRDAWARSAVPYRLPNSAYALSSEEERFPARGCPAGRFPAATMRLRRTTHTEIHPTMTHALIVEDDADSAETMAAL